MMEPHKFVLAMMREVHRRYPAASMIWCLQWSLRTVKEFMRMERIEYGDARYSWDSGGAVDLVDAFDYP